MKNKFTILVLLTFTLCAFKTLDFVPISANQIEGFWMSEANDLKIEVYKTGETYSGKIVWFACDPKTPNMADFKDTKNPDDKLKTRPWLGMVVLNDLVFNNDKGFWNNGKIYDPNSGKTFSSTVKMGSADNIVVKSFWKLEVFSKSLKFNRAK